MTTTIDILPTKEGSRSPTGGSPGLRARGRTIWRILTKLITAIVGVSLVAFNTWWYWRDTRALPGLAEITRWIGKEQYGAAEPALREHLRRAPHHAEVMVMLARVRAARGDLLGCARQLHEVPYWAPQKAEAMYREGQSYLQLDRARDAELAWLELIKNDPLHPVSPGLFEDACMALLKLYAIEDRWEDGYPVIWNAYDRATGTDEHLNWLTMRMRAELERITPKESIAHLNRYVAAAADDWEALRALARAELALGQADSADRHFQDCLKGQPDFVRAWRDYLNMLLERGDLERFLVVLEHLPRSAEKDPETWYLRGVASDHAGDWSTAASHFRKAIELNPFLAKCYYRLGMAEERLGSRDQAAVYRKKSAAINEARRGLPAAYAEFFDSVDPKKTGAPSPANAARRLALICETMGLGRAASAWNRVADGQAVTPIALPRGTASQGVAPVE
jgi:tetratricopeptide (TPR) repeat protein